MENVIPVLSLIMLTLSCVMFWKARQTYAALNDHNGIGELKRDVEALKKDRDVKRAQEAHSGETEASTWDFPVPPNVHPRVVDFTREGNTT
jgi:hypothetical protein